MLYDISADITKAAVYPGDPAPKLERVRSLEKGGDCNLSVLSCCLHNGTHVDAPLHFMEGGDSIDKIPLENFIGECFVLSVPPGPITGDYVERYFPTKYRRLLVKGGGNAYFHSSGASALAEREMLLVGIDSFSVGISGTQAAVHREFLREKTALLEGLVLSDVPDGEYFLMAQPVKIGAAEAAPVRAVLASGHIFWNGRRER